MTFQEFKTAYPIPLDPQQEQAVQATEGPVLLLAVPGSGKTTTLVARLGYMVLARGIPPESILTVTYTVAATRDMRGRFSRFFGEELGSRMEFRTINGLCARVIYTYERQLERKAFQLISDEGQLANLVGELIRRHTGTIPTESDIAEMRTAISYSKNMMLSPQEMREIDRETKGFSAIRETYDRALVERSAMDFDDQMVYALQILQRYPDILEAFRRRCRYLCVDEAQDTSKIQHRIIHLLSSGSGNLFMVGDEDQSIYGFRAAYPAALLEFEKTYPGAKVLLMERNYRSTAQIVTLADRFIRQNKDRHPKEMVSVRGSGQPVREISVSDRKKQYQYLLKVARGCEKETAVLYRDNESALPLVDLLQRQGIPFRCRQADCAFFTHRVVRDITDIIHLARDSADSGAFLRVYYKFSSGITKAAAQSAVQRSRGLRPLLELAAEDSSLSEWSQRQCIALQSHLQSLLAERGDKAIYRIAHFMGYGAYLLDRGMDLNRIHILEALGEQEESPLGLLRRLEELRRMLQDSPGDPHSPFILSTIHSSKGLEYERVFLVDVMDSIFPKEGTDVDLEEERRLFYVGMTRAKDELNVFSFQKPGCTSSFSRVLFGKPEAKKNTLRPAPKPSSSPTRAKPVTLLPGDFQPGSQVLHRQFGRGVVVEKRGEVASIRFESGEVKRLSLPAALRSGALKKG